MVSAKYSRDSSYCCRLLSITACGSGRRPSGSFRRCLPDRPLIFSPGSFAVSAGRPRSVSRRFSRPRPGGFITPDRQIYHNGREMAKKIKQIRTEQSTFFFYRPAANNAAFAVFIVHLCCISYLIISHFTMHLSIYFVYYAYNLLMICLIIDKFITI